MSAPTIQELNEALSYLDRSLTILKSMTIPQISPPLPQLQSMQTLFLNKLYYFCNRLCMFISIGDSMNDLRLLAWLDTIMDLKKQMWDGGKGRALYNMVRNLALLVGIFSYRLCCKTYLESH